MSPIVQLIIQQAPGIIAMIRAMHAARTPEAPPLSNEQVLAALEEAFSSSFAKDQMLKAALRAEIGGQ